MSAQQAGISNREVEPPPLMPGWFCLSDDCLDTVTKAWSKIGARLMPVDRRWVRFIVQLDAECAKAQKERRPTPKTAPWLADERRRHDERKQRNKRHRAIAKAADGLADLIAAEFADSSQAAPSLQEKLGSSVSLSPLADAVGRIASAARSNETGMGKVNGRPRCSADREDLVVNLARICAEAGGRPSRRNAFWEGIDAINRELPQLAKVPNVSGLAERARKGRWLTKLNDRAKPPTQRPSIF